MWRSPLSGATLSQSRSTKFGLIGRYSLTPSSEIQPRRNAWAAGLTEIDVIEIRDADTLRCACASLFLHPVGRREALGKVCLLRVALVARGLLRKRVGKLLEPRNLGGELRSVVTTIDFEPRLISHRKRR